MSLGVAGIVLAAGLSRRMGQSKALLPWRGSPFIDSVVDLLGSVGADPVVVVLGPEPDQVRRQARLERAHVAVNLHFADGQFSSLKCGLEYLLSMRREEEGVLRAVIVALVDQPHVPAQVPRELIREFLSSGAAVVRPTWQGRGGHPILLSCETFPLILALPRTATLYDVVKRYTENRRDVPSPDGSVVTDIDTPEDFSRLTGGGTGVSKESEEK